MASPKPHDHPEWLQPDEEVLLITGRHPLSILDSVLWTTIAIGILIAILWGVGLRVLPEAEPYAVGITVLLVLFWAASMVALYWRVVTSRYIVTADRVYRAHGRLRFFLLQTTYDKVTDLHVDQSLFGRIWGFGNVTSQTAGVGLPMQGVRDPLAMKRRIERARRAFIERLLSEHGLKEAERRAALPRRETETAEGGVPAWVPVEAEEDMVLHRDGPVGFTLVPATLSALAVGGVGVIMTLGAIDAGEPQGIFTFVGPLMLIFAIMTFAQAFIQYRFTRYEVRPWGVVVTSGWLARRRVETTFDKVTDVATYQGVIGRMLDYGNIRINTAGSNTSPVNFNGLARPERVKELIDEARRRRDRRD